VAYLRKFKHSPLQKSQFIPSGDQFFDTLANMIQGAQQEILLEFYIFANDVIGQRILQELIAKQKSGVQVTLYYDGFGSIETADSFFDPLLLSGAIVARFNPLRWQNLYLNINFRNHNKFALIDNRWILTGGINISKDYSYTHQGMDSFLDFGVLIESSYNLVDDLSHTIRKRNEGRVWSPEIVRDLMLVLRGKPWRNWVLGPRQNYKDDDADDQLQVISRTKLRQKFVLLRYMKHKIRSAHQSLDLLQAYFVPPSGILAALRKQAKAGIKIRLIMSERSDVFFVKYAMSYLAYRMRNWGVEIYVHPPRKIHAKMVMVDGENLLFGSPNLNYRSLIWDHDTLFSVRKSELVVDAQEFFNHILNHSQPYEKRISWIEIVLGFIFYRFRVWM